MKELDKELRCKIRTQFMHYRKNIVVELLPVDIIRLRLLKQCESSAVSIEISQLYYDLVKRRLPARK